MSQAFLQEIPAQADGMTPGMSPTLRQRLERRSDIAVPIGQASLAPDRIQPQETADRRRRAAEPAALICNAVEAFPGLQPNRDFNPGTRNPAAPLTSTISSGAGCESGACPDLTLAGLLRRAAEWKDRNILLPSRRACSDTHWAHLRRRRGLTNGARRPAKRF